MNLLLLALAWLGWAALHSLLIGLQARRLGEQIWSPLGRHWRFSYALIAGLTLIPVALVYRLASGGPDVLTWPNQWLPGLLWLAAVVMFVSAARAFGPLNFLGLNTLLGRPDKPRPERPLSNGILGWIRHPFYLSALVLLWARNLDRAGLVTSLILSAYLLIGGWLEEKRLAMEWGPAWLDYRKQVSAFLPIKKLKRFMTGQR